MSVRAIDLNNDWTFGEGLNNYRVEIEEVSQLIKTRLQSFLGDCFFALDDGLDWFRILGSKNQNELSLRVSNTILNVPNVVRILDFNLKIENRRANLDFEILTIYGRLNNFFELDLSNLLSVGGE